MLHPQSIHTIHMDMVACKRRNAGIFKKTYFMLSNLFQNVNWLAVLVASAAYYVIGALWYTILGNGWMKAAGLSREVIRQDFNKVGYLITFLAEIILVAFMAGLISFMKLNSASEGAQFGLIVGLIFSGLTTYIHYIYAMRPRMLIWFDAGYTTVASMVAGMILAVWR